MKVSREQVKQNRERILEAAARLFRERGFDGVSVAEIMKAAGLTHGGFYGHFESKDALIKEAMAQPIAATAPPRRSAAQQSAADFADGYLSARHRDNRADGCPVAGLGSEAVRASPEVRAELTKAIREQIERFSPASPGATAAARRRAAIATYAAMVGALTLARVVDDEKLSAEILAATRKSLDLN
jgi:TetR/AcrR family transcriptional regulator, transcriptional repressor for nem operon